MTVSTTLSRVIYSPGGSVTEFAVPFPFFDADDLVVTERVIATGAESTKVLNTDYAVSGGAGASGTVTAASPPPATVQWVIRRVTPKTQEIDYVENDPFPAATHEEGLDRAAMRIMDMQEQLDRAPKFSISDPAASIGDYPNSVTRAGKVFVFDTAGKPSVTALADLDPAALLLAPGDAGKMLRVNAGENALELRAPSAVLSDIGAAASGHNHSGTYQPLAPDLTAIAAIAASAGRRLVSDGAGWVADDTPLGLRNRLINGGFSVNQRGATSVADDAYCLDRWYALTETGNVTVAQQTLQENGTPFNIRLTQPDVAAKRIGLAQIVEAVNCRDLRGKSATLRLRVRNSDGGQVNYAILEWSGTADAVTSDVISAWAGSPTYIASIAERAKGTLTPAANTWTDVVALTSTINAAANNLIVLIWSNAAMAQNATLDLARVQLEEGAVATPIEGRPHGIEFELCRRYLRVVNALNLWAYNTTALNGILDYSGMRAPPTLSLTGTLSCSDGIIAATAQSSANIGIAVSGGTAMRISMQNFTGLTQYRPYYIDPGASTGVIRVDSEL